MNQSAQLQDSAAGEAVLAEAVAAYRESLGDRLIAAYALGSLAHGGFSPLVSDVDLGLLIADPLSESDAEVVAAVAGAVRAAGSDLNERLSVFWGTPRTLSGEAPGGRFPPLDRLDLLEHGRLLDGQDLRAGVRRPDRSELIVAGAEFALDYLGVPEHTEQIRHLELLVGEGVRRVTKVVLLPVRFLFTAASGAIGTNRASVGWYLGAGGAPGAELVAAAFGWRAQLPHEPAGVMRLLERHLVPLYLHYIDDHSARLAELGRPDLARAFDDWATRIGR